jgi:hypothetical protein
LNIYSDISLFWLLPILIGSAVLSYYYYRNQDVYRAATRRIRIALLSLRGLAIFLCLTLLLGILIERSVSRSEKPLFVLLTDNSASMLNYKDSSTVLKDLNSLKTKFYEQFGERFEMVELNVSDTVSSGKSNFKGRQTDLNSGFEYLFNQYYSRNIGGICLISDGNYNKGIDPVYSVEKLSLTPVFTLGVGDTILKRDQLIRTMNANSIAFLDNEFPIEVTVEAKKFKGKRSKLSLYRSGKEIQSKVLDIKDDHDFITELFIVKADAAGFFNYEARLEVLSGEVSSKNNLSSLYIEVIDTRTKILLLAEAPHPDVAAIRSALEENERTEVISSTIDKFDGNFKDVELVVFHGLKAGNGERINRDIIEKKIPCWYFYTSDSDASLLSGILGAKLPSAKRYDDVQAYENGGFQLFERSDKLNEMLRSAPPVQVRFGSFEGNLGDIWLQQRIGGVSKKDVVLSFKTVNGRKNAFFFGEGLWRWRLNEFVKTGKNEGFQDLVQRTIQYLTVKQNTEPLRIYLPEEFISDKDIEIRAEFYNQALKSIVTPDIELKLKSLNGKEFNYRFSKRNSDYLVNLGKHSPGAYTFEVSTSYDGKKYKKTGSFVVKEQMSESLATHSDFGLLRKLADRSSGSFYKLKEHDRLLTEISKREDIVNVSYSESKFTDLIDWVWLLAGIILLLGTEWFLRRYNGNY